MRQFCLALLAVLVCGGVVRGQSALGIFEGQNDVGDVLHPGSAEFDAATKTYTVSGSGGNIWADKDQFYFVWKKVSADNLTLTADVSILTTDGDPHRKAVLMVRQSLDANSAYADAARHGEGLTSLQSRDKKGAITREVESSVSGPTKLRLEKRGNRFFLWVAPAQGELEFAGGSAWIDLREPFYIGIGVCAHNKDSVVKASFSNVELETDLKRGKGKYSTVETILLSGDARTAYVSRKHLSSPGWSADGHALTFTDGKLDQQTPFLPLATAAPVGPPVSSKADDGFSYYTSKTSGMVEIWRRSKTVDGSQAEQFTPNDYSNVEPHVSPDGKYLLYLSYSKEYERLSEGMPVELRLMLLSDKTVKTLATFVGGPESLGPEPWSPDGKRAVFVSYQSGLEGK